MRIIILGTAWPYRGGLATFNERLAKQFAMEGHDVELWTFTRQYPNFLFIKNICTIESFFVLLQQI